MADDVIGPAEQGIDAGEFRELVRAIRRNATYVNVHTEDFPSGELRGNVIDSLPEDATPGDDPTGGCRPAWQSGSDGGQGLRFDEGGGARRCHHDLGGGRVPARVGRVHPIVVRGAGLELRVGEPDDVHACGRDREPIVAHDHPLHAVAGFVPHVGPAQLDLALRGRHRGHGGGRCGIIPVVADATLEGEESPAAGSVAKTR